MTAEPGGGAVRQVRLAEVIAARLRGQILDGSLRPGETLPTQEELAEQFRVSHPSVRDALRILETEGLVSVRRGRFGGAVVHAPTAASAAYSVGLALQAQMTTLEDLGEALIAMEPMCAAMCARRADRATTVVPVLRQSLAEQKDVIGDGPGFTAASRAFHEAVVDLCGNQTARLVVSSLAVLWSEQEKKWSTEVADRYPERPARDDVLRAHKRLADAIDKGDATGAERLARTHVAASQRYWFNEQVIAAPGGPLRM